MKPTTGTVRDLIAKLLTYNPDAIVILEGCDCVGDWNGEVEEDAKWHGTHVGEPTVVLNRDDGPLR